MKILVLNFIMPFVILLVGSMFKKHPVSDMSSQNGYNTPASRKSQAHWDYAQEIAPDIFISLGKALGIIEAVCCFILLFFEVSPENSVMIGNGIGVAFLIYGFYDIDSRIEKKFADDE